MIGLSRALGQHDIGALITRLRHEEFELSRLVAAGRHPGAIVALDPDLRTIEVASEIGEMFQRRREMTKADARKTRKIHRSHPYFCSLPNGSPIVSARALAEKPRSIRL